MGWFSDAWNAVSGAVSSAADAVGTFVEEVVSGAAEAVADVGESVASGVEQATELIAEKAESIPVVGGFVAGVTRWAGDVVSAGVDLAASIVVGATNLVGDVAGGAIKIIGGVLSLDGGLIGEGFGDIGAGIAQVIIIPLGKGIAFVETLLALEKRRRLTDEEKCELVRIYGPGLSLHNIRIVDGTTNLFDAAVKAFSPQDAGRPFTMNNTIYMKDTTPSEYRKTLVHESVHVWQYQHTGQGYAIKALAGQANEGPEAYDWRKDVREGATNWNDFGKEAQASFIEEVWDVGELRDTTTGAIGSGRGVFFDDDATHEGRFIDEATSEIAQAATRTIRFPAVRISTLFNPAPCGKAAVTSKREQGLKASSRSGKRRSAA